MSVYNVYLLHTEIISTMHLNYSYGENYHLLYEIKY
jgi:hypothetical protein